MIDLMPNPTIAVQWVIFVIAVATLHFGIFKPTLEIIQRRRARSIGARHDAAAFLKKGEEKTSVLEKRLEEARKLGYQQKEEIVHQGEHLAEEVVRKAREDVERSLDGIRSSIEQEYKEASLQIRQYAQELSRDVAVKVLERNL